jgi:hypothetical protein
MILTAAEEALNELHQSHKVAVRQCLSKKCLMEASSPRRHFSNRDFPLKTNKQKVPLLNDEVS